MKHCWTSKSHIYNIVWEDRSLLLHYDSIKGFLIREWVNELINHVSCGVLLEKGWETWEQKGYISILKLGSLALCLLPLPQASHFSKLSSCCGKQYYISLLLILSFHSNQPPTPLLGFGCFITGTKEKTESTNVRVQKIYTHILPLK